MSLSVPLVIIGLILSYLAYNGTSTSTTWLALNTLDALRALRTTRSNGRRIGVVTRRKAMRDSLVCWIVFVTAQHVTSIPDSLLGWLSLYGALKMIICGVFLSSRVVSSTMVYTSFIFPFLRRYGTPIDLTLLLLHSIGVLIVHYLVQVPLAIAWQIVINLSSSVFGVATSSQKQHTGRVASVRGDSANVDPDAITEVMPQGRSPRSVSLRLGSRAQRPRQPGVQPEISHRHAHRPRSPAITVSISDDDLSRPSTPPPPLRPRSADGSLQPATALPTIRRSPRRHPHSNLLERDTNSSVSFPAESGPSRLPAQNSSLHLPPSSVPPLVMKPPSRSLSRSAPSARSANLPGRATRRPDANVKAATKASPIASNQMQPDHSSAPGARTKLHLPRRIAAHLPSSASIAPPSAFSGSLAPSKGISGSGRPNSIRSSTRAEVGDSPDRLAASPTTQNLLYPRLLTPMSVKPISVAVLGREKERTSAAKRSRSIRILSRTDEMRKEEHVGEKRRASIVTEAGERRVAKRGRVDVRADG